MSEPVEIYRDPQIDELLGELRILQSDLCDIRWAIYSGSRRNCEEISLLRNAVDSSVSELRRTIEQTFCPWYLRIWYALRRIPDRFRMRQMASRAKVQQKVKIKHIAENAWRVQVGRFRSRYL